jgi:endonuclease/exonuclease/phosphatase family metal-dependent hydrolase
VLESLVARTCLKTEPYGYALTAGADRRGIQVALLYRLADFEKLEEHSYRIDLAGARPTRDILHVCGKLCSGDTLDILLCHFPSQSGGEMETEWMRRRAGRRLRGLCDSLAAVRRNGGHLLVMGDFNEGADSEVLRNDVGATPWKKPLVSRDPLDSPAAIVPRRLHLMPCAGGTHKYHGEWSPLDRIIAAESLLDTIGTLRLDPESVRCMDTPFLMVEDKTYGGRRPRHTFYGHRYEAGPSDHLPLLFSLLLLCSPPERAPLPVPSN